MLACTYACAHTHTHTLPHTPTHTHTHTHTHSLPHTPHTHAHTRTHIRTHAHTCTHRHTHCTALRSLVHTWGNRAEEWTCTSGCSWPRRGEHGRGGQRHSTVDSCPGWPGRHPWSAVGPWSRCQHPSHRYEGWSPAVCSLQRPCQVSWWWRWWGGGWWW